LAGTGLLVESARAEEALVSSYIRHRTVRRLIDQRREYGPGLTAETDK